MSRIQAVNAIFQHIDKILKYCEDVRNSGEFQQNPLRVDACAFNLMQIGEIIETKFSEIHSVSWENIHVLSQKIKHEYSSVNPESIWKSISDDLPILKKELEKYL